MSTRIRKFGLGSIGVAAAVALTLGVASMAVAAADKPPKIKAELTVGVGIDAAYAPFLVAAEKGFMRKYGLAVKLRIFPSGAEALEAVLTGQADSTGNGQYNIPLVAARGGKIKVIAQYETSAKQFGVVAKGISRPQDLLGKTVATQFGTSPEYYYHRYTRHYKLDESKIKLVNLTFAQMVPALARGDIDAFFAFEPHLARAVDAVSGARVIGRSGDRGIMLLRVFLGVSEKVYSNRDVAQSYLRALIDAGKWANTHKTETAEMISKSYNIPIDDAKTFVGYFNYDAVNLDCGALASLDDVNEYLAGRGILKEKPDLKKSVDTSFMKRVDPKRVCKRTR